LNKNLLPFDSKKKITPEEISEAIANSIDVFSDYVITEELFRMRMRKAELDCQILQM